MSDRDSIDTVGIPKTKMLLDSLESYLRDLGDFYLPEIEGWVYFKWTKSNELEDLYKVHIGSELGMLSG